MTHNNNCVQVNAEWIEATKVYKETWTNYCRVCGGNGGSVSHYDPSSSGISLAAGYLIEYEPCHECSEKGICPRCGLDGLTSEERGDESTGDGPCTICGWNQDPGLCDAPGCWCDEQDNLDHHGKKRT